MTADSFSWLTGIRPRSKGHRPVKFKSPKQPGMETKKPGKVCSGMSSALQILPGEKGKWTYRLFLTVYVLLGFGFSNLIWATVMAY